MYHTLRVAAVSSLLAFGFVGSRADAAVIGAYGFGEPAGPTRVDAVSGGVKNATLSGNAAVTVYGAAPVPDGTYGALTLTGSPLGPTGGMTAPNAEWITAAGTPYDTLTNDFTVMAWVQPSTTTGVKRVFGRNRFTGSTNNGWSFGLNGAEIVLTGHGIVDVLSVGAAIDTGWQHIAITKSSTGGVTFYKNGNLVSTVTTTAATNPFLATSGNLPTWILLNTFGGQNFTGLVDEVRVYDTVLSQADLRTAAVTPIVPEPATAAAAAVVTAGLLAGRRRRRHTQSRVTGR